MVDLWRADRGAGLCFWRHSYVGCYGVGEDGALFYPTLSVCFYVRYRLASCSWVLAFAVCDGCFGAWRRGGCALDGT